MISNTDETQVANPLAATFAPVAAHLHAVEATLQECFQHENAFIDELLKHGSAFGGKRMRPALHLLVGQACGKVTDEHITIGAVIEMIHTASLVHDDVLDEADTRRHLPTIHRQWNLESSVLFGDFLFTKAFCVVGERVGKDAFADIAKVTNEVCEGELKQISHRGNFEMTEAEYFEVIESKTASLVACAAKWGARLAGAEEEAVAAFDEYGLCLGNAFQIADDLLDLAGNEAMTGKSLGRDLEMSKPTLPLILALQKASTADRTRMKTGLEEQSVSGEEVCEWVNRHGGIEAAQSIAKQYASRAAQLARKHAKVPELGEALVQISDFVVERRY